MDSRTVGSLWDPWFPGNFSSLHPQKTFALLCKLLWLGSRDLPKEIFEAKTEVFLCFWYVQTELMRGLTSFPAKVIRKKAVLWDMLTLTWELKITDVEGPLSYEAFSQTALNQNKSKATWKEKLKLYILSEEMHLSVPPRQIQTLIYFVWLYQASVLKIAQYHKGYTQALIRKDFCLKPDWTT